MKIYKIAATAQDMERIYDGLKDVLEDLHKNNTVQAKNELKKLIRKLEEIKPSLKYHKD